MRRLSTLALSALLFAAACGGRQDRVRFQNQPPVTAVNDREDVPERPEKRRFRQSLDPYELLVHEPVARALELPRKGPALNTNSLGEVPDSTWFENRIGVRDLSLEEIRRGPNRGRHPMKAKPWKIVAGKQEGVAPGFIIEDARGVRYILKLDNKRFPEYESGAHIIVHRLLWALGYNVPEDYLVHVRRDELILPDDAIIEDVFGDERRLTEKDVEETLEICHRTEQGYRGIVTEFVPGVPIGGFPEEGVRASDPNDVIPHQRRRELRGLYPIFAWLKHTDVKDGNTLDAWVEDPRDPSKHYILHYLIDFGKALGVIATTAEQRDDGYAHIIDFEHAALSFFTLGLYQTPRERLDQANRIPGVGYIAAENYAPGEFKVRLPYLPIQRADRFDAFWAAALLIRFSPAQIRAAVEQADYSDPRAADYLTRVLIERQRRTARYWFLKVNPLDRFEVTRGERGHRLCFSDLLLAHDLARGPPRTEYRARARGYGGAPTGWRRRARPDAGGRACLGGLTPGRSHEGYLIVEIETRRPGFEREPVRVHLALGPGGRLRVIGVRRR